MSPYIGSASDTPVALLTGAVEPAPTYRGPGMSPAFRARRFDFLDAQAREVTPPRARGNRRAAYCVSLAFPVCFAIGAAFVGDLRLCAILCLMTVFMAVVGLLTLDGAP